MASPSFGMTQPVDDLLESPPGQPARILGLFRVNWSGRHAGAVSDVPYKPTAYKCMVIITFYMKSL